MPSAPFSTTQAVELGKFVLSAYDLFSNPDPDAVPGLPAGYALVAKIYADDITTGVVSDFKVFGFIARSGGDVVVAIRGTEDVFEWIADVEFRLVDFPFVKAGRTEHGFTSFYSSLRTGPSNGQPRAIDVLAALVKGGGVTSLRITGHSLGAALATLLAIDVAANAGFANPVIYTFASPRVGDKVFAGTYDGLVETSWRVANVNDVVTQLPPQFVGYLHVDADFPINSDDHTKHTITCLHSLETYLNTLDPGVPLDPKCVR